MEKLVIRLGRRGMSLLLFGLVWIAISHAFFIGKLGPAPGGIFEFVPPWVIGTGWVVTGAYAIVSAFMRKDWGGFTLLMVMPLVRAIAFLWAWIAYIISSGDTGAGDGFVQALIYGLISGVIFIIGGWPEPLRLPDDPEKIIESLKE